MTLIQPNMPASNIPDIPMDSEYPDNLSFLGVSVHMHGVKGDGRTDDTAALNRALATDNVIYIPPGKYLVSRSADYDFKRALRLYKRNNVTIFAHKDAEIISSPDMSSLGFSMLSIMGCNNVKVIGLKFSVYASGIPVDRTNCRAVEVTTDTDSIAVEHNTLIPSDNITFTDNEFHITHPGYTDAEFPALYGIHCHTPESSPTPLVTGIKIINNTWRDSDGRLCQSYLCDDVLVQGNRFLNCAPVAYALAIRMIGGSSNVRVISNYIEISSGAPAYSQDSYGIAVTGSTDPAVMIPANNVLVQNNIITMKYRYNTRGTIGLYVAWGKNVSVIGNTFVGVQGSGDSLKGDGIRLIQMGSGLSNDHILIDANSFINISQVPIYNLDPDIKNTAITNNMVGLTTDSVSNITDTFGLVEATNNFIELFGGFSNLSELSHTIAGESYKEIWSNGLPASGTFERGSLVRNINATPGGITEWTTTVKGTAGALVGVTANTVNGSNIITVNDASNLRLKQYITVAGAGLTAVQIFKINGNQVTVTANAAATINGAAVSNANPVFTVSGQSGVMSSIAAAPTFVGQLAVVGAVAYIAVGTAASTDWKQISN